MRKIRKLYLQNAAGERYGLNGERGVYVSSLAGFGFTMSTFFADLGRGFYIPVSDESEPQSTVPFTVHFTQNPYESYNHFVDWLTAAGAITIVYDPTGSQEYCRDVVVNFVQKTELNEVGWLEIPCSYYCVTPWYLPTPTSLTLAVGGTVDNKRYDYIYGESLIYGHDSTAAMSGAVAGAGHVPGALRLTYYGAAINPKIRLVGDISGKTYGICSVAVTLIPSDTLEFSTKYEDSFVRRVSAAGDVTDLLDVLDLSKTPFFRIPVDEPCTVTIEADAPLSGHAEMTIFYYYRSV